jgi:hypothetical protein
MRMQTSIFNDEQMTPAGENSIFFNSLLAALAACYKFSSNLLGLMSYAPAQQLSQRTAKNLILRKNSK